MLKIRFSKSNLDCWHIWPNNLFYDSSEKVPWKLHYWGMLLEHSKKLPFNHQGTFLKTFSGHMILSCVGSTVCYVSVSWASWCSRHKRTYDQDGIQLLTLKHRKVGAKWEAASNYNSCNVTWPQDYQLYQFVGLKSACIAHLPKWIFKLKISPFS